MSVLLYRLLYISFTAGGIVLVVLAARFFMRSLPKFFSYALWFIVLFRFLCPVSIPSPLSLLPVQPEPVLQEIMNAGIPVFQRMPETSEEAVAGNLMPEDNDSAADPEAAASAPIYNIMLPLTGVWAAGVLMLFSYGLFLYQRLRQRLATAVRAEPGVYESDLISGAFTVGLFHPAIYLPVGLNQESRKYILCHERAHIIHRDYLVKLAGLLMVTLHWFNPLAWLSFHLLCQDMEMTNDERVVRILGLEEKKPYALALLQAGERSSGILLLSFGESDAKSRIKNILNYQKPKLWVSLLLAVLIIITGIGLVTSPAKQEILAPSTVSIIGGADGPTSIFLTGKINDEDDVEAGVTAYDQMPDEEWLMQSLYQVGPLQGQNEITLDMASEDYVVFHGEFGLFSFENENGQWNLSTFIPGTEGEEIAKMLGQLSAVTNTWSDDEIHWETDRLRLFQNEIGLMDEPDGHWQWLGFESRKMANGSIAVLGSYQLDGTARLIDLSYGYYNPEDQVFHQVYLFLEDNRMIENQAGQITYLQYITR